VAQLTSKDLAPHIMSTSVVTVTTSGTRVQLASDKCRMVRVVNNNESYKIIVGDDTVAKAGLSDPAIGQVLGRFESIVIPVTNANELYLDSDTDGAKAYVEILGDR
tara:strand:- start:14993 stop:15310 length:318 start_codon:yes stop_codon:yes gene_type:complete